MREGEPKIEDVPVSSKFDKKEPSLEKEKPPEGQEVQQENQGNRPGGSIPEWQLWQPKVVRGKNGQQRESSVKSPDGKTYEIKDGEQFVVESGENGDYEAAIIDRAGKKNILRESLASKKAGHERQDREELDRLRESLGLKVEKTEGSAETKEMRELNEKLKPAAEYLDRLDRYVEGVEVNPDTGKIKYEKPKLEDVTDEKIRKYKENFEQLLRDFKDRNKAYMEKLRADPAILDVQEIAGAIVATYDSSKGTPKVEGFDSEHRGSLATDSEEFLGLATIDINKERRKDKVTPETSTIHELNHHMLSVSDRLISKDENIDMESAHRRGFGTGKDKAKTNMAFEHDKEQYSAALGREFDLKSDGPRVEVQSRYLDELHSSYMQKAPEWFDAQKDVYSTRGDGKHWELVGDHPDDIKASKDMLGYLQGFYTMDKVKDYWQQQLDNGGPIGEGQKKFMKECEEEFRKVGSIIGTARTVKQAETMVAEAWKSFIEKNQRVAQTPVFKDMIDGWEKGGAGVENIRELLLGKK